MSAKYQSKHLQTIFNISPQTVRTWSTEFERHLSASANPAKGRHRIFTEDDVAIFSLVKELRFQGMVTEEIHAALVNGQRGIVPALPSDDMVDLVASQQGLAIFNKLEELTAKVASFEQRLETIQQVGDVHLRAQINDLKQQLQQAQGDKLELMRTIGRLEERLETLQNKE